MARASLAVELRAHPIALPALAGEAGLLAARRDGEAHQVAARPVWRLAAQKLRLSRERMTRPAWLRLAAWVLLLEQLPPGG